MSEELCWLCNVKVWIFKLWFVLFYIYNHDVTLTLYINWTVFYINKINKQVLGVNIGKHFYNRPYRRSVQEVFLPKREKIVTNEFCG